MTTMKGVTFKGANMHDNTLNTPPSKSANWGG